MDTVLMCLASFLAAAVTLFSGFGLGTLLMPFFALFFPLQSAIALTAIVHLLNNALKLILFGRDADRHVVLQFGVPPVFAAVLGAWALRHLSNLTAVMHYRRFDHDFEVMPVKVAVATLLVLFTLSELRLKEGTLSFDRKCLPLGGIMSGFFGGPSGHQGALRSAFIVRSGLSKDSFLGTSVVIACLVDMTRLLVYGVALPSITQDGQLWFLLAVISSTFAGTWWGNQLAPKVTIRTVQAIVSIMVFGIAIGLGSGPI